MADSVAITRQQAFSIIGLQNFLAHESKNGWSWNPKAQAPSFKQISNSNDQNRTDPTELLGDLGIGICLGIGIWSLELLSRDLFGNWDLEFGASASLLTAPPARSKVEKRKVLTRSWRTKTRTRISSSRLRTLSWRVRKRRIIVISSFVLVLAILFGVFGMRPAWPCH